MKPIDKAYQEELERLEVRYSADFCGMILCDRCKREFRYTGDAKPKEFICPICQDDADI